MHVLFALVVLLLAVPALAAPTLEWDPVTQGTDGTLLSPGNAVTAYKVYRCGTSTALCTKSTGILAGTVTAPTVTLDLAGQPIPQAYVVTAVNPSGESLESTGVRVIPPDVPKNHRLK